MSLSDETGKLYTLYLVAGLAQAGRLSRLVDIGAGAGLYRDILADAVSEAHWTALEIWQPFIDEYQLSAKYDEVIEADVRRFEFDHVAGADLVLFGDVLEHMQKAEAQSCVARALQSCRMVLISIPIVPSPANPDHPNPYLRHVKEDWSDKEVRESFTHLVTGHRHGGCGVYTATRDADLQQLLPVLNRTASVLARDHIGTDQGDISWWDRSVGGSVTGQGDWQKTS